MREFESSVTEGDTVACNWDLTWLLLMATGIVTSNLQALGISTAILCRFCAFQFNYKPPLCSVTMLDLQALLDVS